MTFRYQLHPDGVSFTVASGIRAPKKILHTDHTQFSKWVTPDECFNFGVRRHPVLLAAGDRPRLALMRTMPENKADPDLIKLGDGRFWVQVGDEGAWLDELDEIETIFNPAAVVQQVRDGRFPGLAFELKSALSSNWGVLARLTVTNTGRVTVGLAVEMAYGGLRRCPRTFSAAYFPEQPDDGRRNTAEPGPDGAALLHSEDIPDWVGVLGLAAALRSPALPDRVENNELAILPFIVRAGKAVFSKQMVIKANEETALYLLAGRADTKEGVIKRVTGGAAGQFPFIMPQHPPTAAGLETIFTETRLYYQAVLAPCQIETPSPVIDHAFRTSLWNLDSVYALGPWLEGAHWWSAPWTNLFQVSAAIALGQYERAGTALRYFAGHGFGVVKASGSCVPGHDGLLYYIHALSRYVGATGDLALAKQVWPAFTPALAALLEARRGHDLGLLDWRLHCNPFLYQADHLGLPGEAASPSLMAAGMLERLARLARQLGNEEQAAAWEARARLIDDGLRARLWDQPGGYFYGHIDLQGLAHHAHYYTDLCYPALYSALPEEYCRKSLDHLRQSLVYEAFPDELDGKGVLEMRVGDFKPTIFGNDNVMPTQTCEAARAFFGLGDYVTGTRLLEGVALAGTVHTEAPGNFPEHMSFLGKGEANYLFGNPIASYAYAVVDGLFGAVVMDGGTVLRWQPGFPDDWDHAHLRLPDMQLDYHQALADGCIRRVYRVRGKAYQLILRLPLAEELVSEIKANGAPVTASWDVFGISCEAAPAPDGNTTIEVILTRLPEIEVGQLYGQQPTSRAWEDSSSARVKAAFANQPTEPVDLSVYYDAATLHVTSAWRNLELSPALSGFRDSTGKIQTVGGDFTVPDAGAYLALVEYGLSDPDTRQTQRSPRRDRLLIPIGRRVKALALLYANEVESRHTGAQVGKLLLTYQSGKPDAIPLVVGETLDTFWSHFARQTIPVRLGESNDFLNVLWLETDPSHILAGLEISIDAPDAVLGLIGMNAIYNK